MECTFVEMLGEDSELLWLICQSSLMRLTKFLKLTHRYRQDYCHINKFPRNPDLVFCLTESLTGHPPQMGPWSMDLSERTRRSQRRPVAYGNTTRPYENSVPTNKVEMWFFIWGYWQTCSGFQFAQLAPIRQGVSAHTLCLLYHIASTATQPW